MEPHGVPSGGDWGLQRMGAIHLEGTKGVTIAECLVTRVDGNAIMLSGYNRNTTISRNEFVWIGDSVIASWGYTAPLGGAANDDVLAQYKSGVDGTNGEQPRGTIASENFIHELGHFEKQSSPWFQAKSCQNLIKRNIFFNMPRAGINFNDGKKVLSVALLPAAMPAEPGGARRVRRRQHRHGEFGLQHVQRIERPRCLQLLGPPTVPD